MNGISLSILIATMPSRINKCANMLSDLDFQLLANSCLDIVEILHDISMNYNIGSKRNKLLQQAKGEYIVFIDDDDEITSNYVSLILDACKSGADCIGISGIITTNGADKRQWHISKDYGSWYTGADGTYYRTPNHISPVKRELALRVGFPEVSFAEDAEYSRRLLPLLKSEVKIEQNIYHYKFIENK
jgi:glycosyltransferase involved in cell wall biosynthesis